MLSQVDLGAQTETQVEPIYQAWLIVQQLSGRDPLAEACQAAHSRAKYPSLRANDDFENAMRELIAGELRALDAQKSNTPETGATANGKWGALTVAKI